MGYARRARAHLAQSRCFQKLQKCNIFWLIFRRVRHYCEKRLLVFVMSVRPSARKEQIGSHWKDFHETVYMSKACR